MVYFKCCVFSRYSVKIAASLFSFSSSFSFFFFLRLSFPFQLFTLYIIYSCTYLLPLSFPPPLFLFPPPPLPPPPPPLLLILLSIAGSKLTLFHFLINLSPRREANLASIYVKGRRSILFHK